MLRDDTGMEWDSFPRSEHQVIVGVEYLEAVGRCCREHSAHHVQRPLPDLLRHVERAGSGVDTIDDKWSPSSSRYDVFDREHLIY